MPKKTIRHFNFEILIFFKRKKIVQIRPKKKFAKKIFFGNNTTKSIKIMKEKNMQNQNRPIPVLMVLKKEAIFSRIFQNFFLQKVVKKNIFF